MIWLTLLLLTVKPKAPFLPPSLPKPASTPCRFFDAYTLESEWCSGGKDCAKFDERLIVFVNDQVQGESVDEYCTTATSVEGGDTCSAHISCRNKNRETVFDVMVKGPVDRNRHVIEMFGGGFVKRSCGLVNAHIRIYRGDKI